MSEIEQKEDRLTVDCYNCTGAKMHTSCGFPILGCTLCETHGQGYGKLFQEYGKVTMVIGDKTFIPPNYNCLMCKDSKVTSQRIWDEDLEDDGCSDHGAHNMPQVKVACWKCCSENSKLEFESAKTKYFDKKNIVIKPQSIKC